MKNIKIYGKRKIYKSLLPKELNDKRINFIPESEPKLLKYNEKIWRKSFPYKKNINFKNLQLSNIGYYSIFYPGTADKFAKIIKSYIKTNNPIITDGTANMGGTTLAFTKYFNKVNAVEIIKLHCDILKNNLKVYQVDKKVDIYCMDYLDIGDKLDQDVVFFDPPWGGPNYKEHLVLDLYLDGISISEIVKALIPKTMVAIRVPYNYDFKKIFALSEKTYIHNFFKPNGEILYNLIIIDKLTNNT